MILGSVKPERFSTACPRLLTAQASHPGSASAAGRIDGAVLDAHLPLPLRIPELRIPLTSRAIARATNKSMDEV
jgi:hypothetical protein